MATLFVWGNWPLSYFLFMAKRATFLFCLWQMAILSFVYGKMATFTKMANDQLFIICYGKWPITKMADGHRIICLWQMSTFTKIADSQVLWPMATKRYVKFIYYANITYSSEERGW